MAKSAIPATTTARSRLVHVATRKSTIAKNISAEYSDYKGKLELLTPTVAKLLGHVRAIDSHWDALVSSQRSFADDVADAYPHVDAFKRRLATAQRSVRDIAEDIASPKSSNHPTVAEASRIEDYLKEIRGVLGECPAVERAYLDTAHYDAKAEKLSRKSKPSEQVATNLEKLTSARIKYQESVDTVVAHMKAVYAKYPAVFSNAHASFWHAQSGASSVVSQNARVLAAAAPKPTDLTAFQPDLVTPSDQDVVEKVEKPKSAHDVLPKAGAAAAGLAGAATVAGKSEKKSLFDFPKKKKTDVLGDSHVGTQQASSPTEDISPAKSEYVDSAGEGVHTTLENKKKPLFARHSFKKQSKDESPTTTRATSPVPVVGEVGEPAVTQSVASKDAERVADVASSAHEKKKSLFTLPSLGKHEHLKEEQAPVDAAAVAVHHEGVKDAAKEIDSEAITPALESPPHGSPEASAEKKKSLFALPSLKKPASGKEDSAAATAAVTGAVAASAAVSVAAIKEDKKASDLQLATTNPELTSDVTENAAEDIDHTADKKKGIFGFPSFKKHDHSAVAGTSGEEEVQVSEGIAVKSADVGAGSAVTSTEKRRSLFGSGKKITAGPGVAEEVPVGHPVDKESETAKNVPDATANPVSRTAMEDLTGPSAGLASKNAAETSVVPSGSDAKPSGVSVVNHPGEPVKPAGGPVFESAGEGKARPLGNMFGFMFPSKDNTKHLESTNELPPDVKDTTALESQSGASETQRAVPRSENSKPVAPSASKIVDDDGKSGSKIASEDMAAVMPGSDRAMDVSGAMDHTSGASPSSAEGMVVKDAISPAGRTPADVSEKSGLEQEAVSSVVVPDPIKNKPVVVEISEPVLEDAKSRSAPVDESAGTAMADPVIEVAAAARTDVVTSEGPPKAASGENIEPKATSSSEVIGVGAVAKVRNMFGFKSKGKEMSERNGAVTTEGPVDPAVMSGVDETVKTDKKNPHFISKKTPVEVSAPETEAVAVSVANVHGGSRAAMPVSPVEAGISPSTPDDMKDEHDGKKHMFRLSSKKKLDSVEEEHPPKVRDQKTLFGLGGKKKVDSAVEANEPAVDGSSKVSVPYWVDSAPKGVDDVASASKAPARSEIAPAVEKSSDTPNIVESRGEDVVESVSKVRGTDEGTPSAAETGTKEAMQVKLDEAKDKVGAVIKKTASKFKIGSKKSAEPST